MGSKSNRFYSYYWIWPALLLYIVFFIAPTLQGVYYSFTYWNIFEARFAGWDNYRNIFTDVDISITLKNTLLFTVITTVFKVVVGFMLALLLNQSAVFTKFMRSVYFMPAVISNIAVALIFSAVLHPEGILNEFMRSIGISFLAMDWLTDTKIVMYSISAIEVWKWSGFTMVILLAGLQTIPKEYNEAADVDGVTFFQRLWHITLPIMLPAFNNALIINLIGGLKVFDIVYAMTGGGPGHASEVLNSFVFKAYTSGHYGEACAASVVVAIMVVMISTAVYRPLRKKEVEL